MRPQLELALRHVARARPDDIRLSAMLAALVAGTVALVSRLGRLSSDVDAHAREVDALWTETEDIRTKLFAIGEDFVDALSSPPDDSGERR